MVLGSTNYQRPHEALGMRGSGIITEKSRRKDAGSDEAWKYAAGWKAGWSKARDDFRWMAGADLWGRHLKRTELVEAGAPGKWEKSILGLGCGRASRCWIREEFGRWIYRKKKKR